MRRSRFRDQMIRACPRCNSQFDTAGGAKLPFCRRCIASLPDSLRRGINNNEPGSRMRQEAHRAACALWGLPEPPPF